jgi:hypothetical protein
MALRRAKPILKKPVNQGVKPVPAPEPGRACPLEKLIPPSLKGRSKMRMTSEWLIQGVKRARPLEKSFSPFLPLK